MICKYSPEDIMNYTDKVYPLEKAEEIRKHLETCEKCSHFHKVLVLSGSFADRDILLDKNISTKIMTAVDRKKYSKNPLLYKSVSFAYRLKTVLKPAFALVIVLCIAILLGAYRGEISVYLSSLLQTGKTQITPAQNKQWDSSIPVNGTSNIQNGGLAVKQGEWTYFINTSDGDKIYKTMGGDSGEIRLNNDISQYLSICGDWLIYRNPGSMGNKYYKMKTDGSGKAILGDNISYVYTVKYPWVYCQMRDNGIYRLNPDTGTAAKLLDSLDMNFINIEGDWIYYSSKSDRNRIYKIKTDGSAKLRLNDYESEYLNVSDSWIYYRNAEKGHNIYKIGVDGGGETALVNDSVNEINILQDWIYYTIPHDGIYKVKTDGSSRTRLTGDYAGSISIAGDWIYYRNFNRGRICRINTDGSINQELSGAPDAGK